jgi:uncharacterized SAM-binding protein YcdF (DUF218 family)
MATAVGTETPSPETTNTPSPETTSASSPDTTSAPALAVTRVSYRALSRAALGAAIGALSGFIVRDLDLPALVSYEHTREPLVFAAAALGAVLALTRLRALLVAVTAALALLWCVVAVTPLSGWLSHGLTRSEAVEPADALFVSLSSLRPGAQGAAEVRNRLFHGLALLARGKAPRLLLCESVEVHGVGIARELMDAAGVTTELVVLPRAQNTRDEAQAVATLAHQRNLKLILLVTSPIHSRRASAALEKEGLTVVSSPSTETRFDLATLSTGNDRLAAFGTVMHERLGLWVYARRGWIDAAVQ